MKVGYPQPSPHLWGTPSLGTKVRNYPVSLSITTLPSVGAIPPPQSPKAHVADARPCLSGKAPGLRHKLTIVRGQGRGGVYAEDRSIRVLGVETPSVSLLPRRDEYTRVYTTVYPRVHNSIHACIQHRSKYILSRARLYVYFLGIIPSIFSDGLRLPRIWNNPPEDPKAGVCERDHASALGRSPIGQTSPLQPPLSASTQAPQTDYT